MFERLLSLLLASTLSLGGISGDVQNSEPAFEESSLIEVSAFPEQKPDHISPGHLSAASSLILDVESRTTLFSDNQHESRPIASLSKLMTAYLLAYNHDMDEIFVINEQAAAVEGSQLHLSEGTHITVREALKAILMKSANDVAVAAAYHHAGSEAAFVNMMNQQAKLLGMQGTRYQDATGLSSGNLSTSFDTATLLKYLTEDPNLLQIMSTAEAEIQTLDGNTYSVTNTNKVLGQYGVLAGKTGTTDIAGECLATLVEQNGNQVVVVVLGSENRNQDTKTLIDWVYRAFIW